MSKEKNLLRTGNEGLLLVGLPHSSEVIVQMLCRKTGRNAAELIGVALHSMATQILDEKEQKELVQVLKECSQ